MLRRTRTQAIDQKELDFMVVQFSCHDNTVLGKLGQHSKEVMWRVQVGHDAVPITIVLNVDKSVVSSARVSVTSDDDRLFPLIGTKAKAKLVEDFRHVWPFRGTIKGFNEKSFFEMRLQPSADAWVPATITGQREDGLFEVTITVKDDHGGPKEICQPAVHKGDIREVITKRPLSLPERHLTLLVPHSDPLNATLTIDGKELMTHYFARPSPHLAPGEEEKKVVMDVAKDRSHVNANVGHSVLAHFMSGEVRSVKCDVHKAKHSWTVQLGPFAEHTILIEKKYSLGKIVTLIVDGEPFIESAGVDIESPGDHWECRFRFVGERQVDMNVFETNRDGVALDKQGLVVKKWKYTHDCHIVVQDERDLRSATLAVDDVTFTELPLKQEPHAEENLSMDPVAMRLTYGIVTPYKVNELASSGPMAMANRFSDSMGGLPLGGRRPVKEADNSFFGQCCCGTASREHDLVR